MPALPYHAGLSAGVRQKNQDRFMNEEGLIIVATVAFGMGIDKPNVRFVAHLDPPKSLEAYHQETGRAGRDGLPADAWMTYGLADVGIMRSMIESGEADAERKRVESQKLTALLGYCESVQCRRTALLGYFGEDHAGGCGNCDNCLTPVDVWDGTVAAQKALSAVYRTDQCFGAAYLSDVLMGKATDRVLRFGHDALKTFGCGDELDKKGWMSVFRQLAASGLVRVDIEGHGGLKLTQASWEVLRGERGVTLRKDPVLARATKKKSRKSRAAALPPGTPDTDEARELFETLRTKRLELARSQNVPPYAVFPDRTLLDMVARRPRTVGGFADLHGVGARKLAAYAEIFLAVLAEHEARHGRPDGLPEAEPEGAAPPPPAEVPLGPSPSQEVTLDLWNTLGDVAAVADARGLSPGTIWAHLLALASLGLVDANRAAGIGPEEETEIREAFAAHGTNSLIPVHEALEGRYGYDRLRMVRAALEGEAARAGKNGPVG